MPPAARWPGDLGAGHLDVGRGSVTLEGLEFVLDSDDRELDRDPDRRYRTDPPPMPVPPRRALGRSRTQVALTSVHHGRPAVERPARPGNRRRMPLRRGQVGVFAQGPVDLLLRDCTLGSSEPAIWFKQGAAAGPVSADSDSSTSA